VLLLSRDSAYRVRAAVTVAPLTRTARSIPVEVRLGLQDGVPEECVVNLDDILAIPKALLDGRITRLSKPKMSDVARAIKFALALV